MSAVEFIPLRPTPDQPDARDGERIELVMKRWRSQDAAYLQFAKTVEEHVRMLSGRQWDQWSDLLGRYVDVLRYMTDEERKYRMRPVMDYLGYWFLVTLSKATENAPAIGFMPSTSDRFDAILAEVMEPVWKTLFGEMEMDAKNVRAVGWALVAGECHSYTFPEFTSGPPRELIAPAVLSLARDDGTLVERPVEAVPFDVTGNPLAQLVPDPETGDYGYDITGDPYRDREGSPKVNILCPLEIRAEWGQHIPWNDKRWVIRRAFLTPADIEQRYGVQVEADAFPDAEDEVGPGYLERLLFGSGYFGAAQNPSIAGDTNPAARGMEGFVTVYEMWERPCPGHTDENEAADIAGGRLLVVAPSAKTEGGRVLWDSLRPFRCRAAGPIRRFGFIDIPGRPFHTTMLERLVPLQKRLNRVEAQIAEHTNLCTNPILFYHESVGIDEDEFVARPGLHIEYGGVLGGGAPAFWLAPPTLSPDVWKHKADVIQQLFTIGALMGNSSETPTASASGDLVEELRYNADRPLTPLTQNLVRFNAEIAEDVLAILPAIWTAEKMITYAGADNVVRTVTVLPEMFEGRVNVKPIVESAAAESKERRRQRVKELFALGAFGDPANPMEKPKAVATLLELFNYPDLTRATRPGGVHRVMAEQNLGRLVRGEPAAAIPILEVYNIAVHLEVTETFMASPEYLTLPVTVQAEFENHRQFLLAARQVQQLAMMARQAPMMAAQAQLAGATQGAMAASAAETGPAIEPGNPEAPSQDSLAA